MQARLIQNHISSLETEKREQQRREEEIILQFQRVIPRNLQKFFSEHLELFYRLIRNGSTKINVYHRSEAEHSGIDDLDDFERALAELKIAWSDQIAITWFRVGNGQSIIELQLSILP